MHRVRAEHEPFRDLPVAQALCDEPQDVELARAQLADVRGLLARGRRGDPEERGDGREHRVDVAVPRQMSVAFEDDELGVRRECGELLARGKADHAIVPAMTTSVGARSSATVSLTSVANVSSSSSAAKSALADSRWNAANESRSSGPPLGTKASANRRLPSPQCFRTSSTTACRVRHRARSAPFANAP